MLRIFTRENKGFLGDKRYIFRSSTMDTVSQKDLIKEIAGSNTTVTETDTLAVLDVTKNVILDYVEKGYTVQTPIGLFYASASGTTDDIQDEFRPEDTETNHTIRFLYRPAADIAAAIRKNTQIVRTGNVPKQIPHIDVVKNAAGTEETSIHTSDTLMLSGSYLQFDNTDTGQGVFLVNDSGTHRLTYYTHNTERRIEVRVESDIPRGLYSVLLKNVPSSRLVETVYDKILTVV